MLKDCYNKIIEVTLWSLAAAVLVSIFLLSAQPAVESNKNSTAVTEVIINTLPPTRNLPAAEKHEIVTNTNNLVRKNAHFAMYFLLGGFIAAALMHSFPTKKWWRLWVIAALVCLIYAISDEVHQIFVDGRAYQARDVLIDLSGSLLSSGIIVMCLRPWRGAAPPNHPA